MGTVLTNKVASTEGSVNQAVKDLGTLVAHVNSLHEGLVNTLTSVSRQAALTEVDPAKLREFLDKPYLVRPLGDNRYELIVPSFIGLAAGWPVRHQGPYSVFLVTRFIHLLNPLPGWLAAELGYSAPDWHGTLEGNTLTVEQGDVPAIVAKLGGKKTVASVSGRQIVLRPASRFEVLRRIIREEGFLPFTPRRVAPEYLRNTPSESQLHLRPHQLRDFQRFLETGAIAIFAYPQTGKSFVVLKVLENLKGRKLIVVPRRTLVDQWQARLELYLGPEQAAEVTVATYQALANPRNALWAVDWSLVVFDEAQHLPADFAIEAAAKLKTATRIGLSATPRREDGNEDLIPALCGFPVGMDWPVNPNQRPPVNVWFCKDEADKLATLRRITRSPADGKTFVFTYRLEIGRRAAELLDAPFVHGGTGKPLEVIGAADTVVISSVGNEGLSFPVRRVVEIDFLFGSGMEAGQRLGRLAYEITGEITGKDAPGEHHILMTQDEYHRYGKRLLIYEQWGLEIRLHAGEGGEGGRVIRSRRPQSDNPLAGTRFKYTSAMKKALATPPVPNGKPLDEIDTALALPAVAARMAKAEAQAGSDARPYVQRAFRMVYETALSPKEIVEGLAAVGRNEPGRYRRALQALAAVDLVRTLENERYRVNGDELARLRKLSGLVRR